MSEQIISQDQVLKIGEVCEVSGRTITVLVDKNKNHSDLFFQGKILKNVSVGGAIEIRKGFTSLIGKIEAEKILEEKIIQGSGSDARRYRRYLTTTLTGYINRQNFFIAGTRELPLIGNEVFVLTEETIQRIHYFTDESKFCLKFARTELEDIEIALPVEGLLNSHIAIFGNTGSGKSNTLATLYMHGVAALSEKLGDNFKQKCKFLLFDFNGEYTSNDCITSSKKVFNLSTQKNSGDKIPMPEKVLLEHEILSVLTDATDKTQKPFLKRAIDFHNKVMNKDNPIVYFRNILKKKVRQTLFNSDRMRCDALLDLFRPIFDHNDNMIADLEYYSKTNVWKLKKGSSTYFNNEGDTEQSYLFSLAEGYEFKEDTIEKFISFMYLQLIQEVISNRSNPEHISPVINRMESKRKDIAKILDTSRQQDFWQDNNFVVVNLNMVNLTMKKMLPLLLAKWVYNDKKNNTEQSILFIIIDEAHNILSNTSFRESESWKDYRLEIFEEIIKEGRKFGTFVTISSQRPNDISPTIISQAHNYFIHPRVSHQ